MCVCVDVPVCSFKGEANWLIYSNMQSPIGIQIDSCIVHVYTVAIRSIYNENFMLVSGLFIQA